MTLKEMRDRLILDAKVLQDPYFPASRVDSYINEAQRHVQNRLNGLGMKKWETETVVLSYSQSAFLEQDDSIEFNVTQLTNMAESPKAIKFLHVYDDTTLGQAHEVTPEEFREVLRNSFMTPTINEPVFTRLANVIYLAPTSITAITAYYYTAITELIDDDDVTEMPVEFIPQVMSKALGLILGAKGSADVKLALGNESNKETDANFEKYVIKQMESTKNETLKLK